MALKNIIGTITLNKLLKHIGLIFLLSVTFGLTALAQPNGNEWINYNQQYYRIPIKQSGIYRITNADLINAGVPLGSFQPKNIQIFARGTEIPCYIEGENQGVLEYIEFYAEKNDGWFDLEMYDNPTSQTNPYLSMITDEGAVFVTWNNLFNNKRYSLETDVNFTGYTPQPYCYVDTLQQYYTTNYNQYREGKLDPEDSEYTEAEGWYDSQHLFIGKSLTKTLGTPNPYVSSLPVTISIAYVSFSVYFNHVSVSGPGFILDTVFEGYHTIKQQTTVEANNLLASTKITFTNIDDYDAPTSNIAASYINIHYPSYPDFNNVSFKRFKVPASGNQKMYLEILNFKSNGTVYLFDLTHQKRIETVKNGTTIQALIPASTTESELVMVAESSIKMGTELAYAPMIKHDAKNKNYILLSHTSLQSTAEPYAAYRNAYLVYADQLYNQFGYGIPKHPLAIRNFLRYVYANWSVKPEYLFILGKGTSAKHTRFNASAFNQCLIPPLGNPATDVLLGTRITGTNNVVSAFKTGRLSALNSSQAQAYFNKVQEFEQNQASEWMKQVIHFGGGINQAEQTAFEFYLQNFANTIKDTLFGAHVSTFLKKTSDPITISKTDSITRLINNGVSLMTFFGHGSTNGFDQNIDKPESYNNKGKYPLMIANSCYSGDIFLTGNQSQSEDWVLIENKGAVGFLAMVYQGYAPQLYQYTDQFYTHMAQTGYGKPIGEAMHQAQSEMFRNSGGFDRAKVTIQGFNLHGDPGIVLNSFEKPDLTIESDGVVFDPYELNSGIDSFYVYLVLKNIARTTSSTFNIKLIRQFPNLTTDTYERVINGLLYKDTIKLKLPINTSKGLGINTFTVLVDNLAQISELDEQNNQVTVQKLITTSSLTAVYPFQYAMLNQAPTVLKACTGSALAPEQASVFQVDTTQSYNSPLFTETTITHPGGVVEANTGINYQSNTTYYWRVRPQNAKNKDPWSEGSFTVKPPNEGWLQRDAEQLAENNLRYLTLNAETGVFEFNKQPSTLRCVNFGSPNNQNYINIGYSIDGNGATASCGFTDAMVVAVIDSATMLPWLSDHGSYGQVNYPLCAGGSSRPNAFFVFRTDSASLTALTKFVNNIVPHGFHVLMYSFRNGNFSKWKAIHYNAFLAWGASEPRFLSDAYPYILYMRKGMPQVTHEVAGATSTDYIELNKQLETNVTRGYMISKTIGPAKVWNSVEWLTQPVEANPAEKAYLKIIGVSNGVTEVELYDTITTSPYSIANIDATKYSWLILEFYTQDEVYRTPSQLKYWQVNYTPVSDLAVNPAKGFQFYADTVEQGEEAKLELAFENIGSQPVDSVWVSYWLQDTRNNNIPITTKKISNFVPSRVFIDTLSFSTLPYSGSYYLWAELNAPKLKAGVAQPEQYRFNNLLQKGIYIKPDATNPLLDVTFDGRHIMDGDIVSARPEIVIQLKDENKFIALTDTSMFSVYLKSQKTGIEEKVSLENNPNVKFLPASLPQNKARVIISASFESDGTYELRVQAVDKSGNESGASDYNIAFEVVNENTITNVFNYPNPFSTSTQFAFELTGTQIPDELRIEIFTVTGRVVKVIYLDELGPLFIGKNLTQYTWNGTDTYGDPLANGVYFYRVFARINGQDIKLRDSGTNQFFKNGFGKMYLMR